MSGNTTIEWATKVWNPLRGCSKVSEGCRNCYAARQAHRFSGPGLPYEDLTQKTTAGVNWTGKINLVPKILDEPLRWRKSERVFVNSMSDLFHENVPITFIHDVFKVMAEANWHTFQVLTKRPERMRAVVDYIKPLFLGMVFNGSKVEWPLPNVWLGVSVENQKAADERIPLLLQTPAAVRFLSMEPLLGPVDVPEVYMKKLDWGDGPKHWPDGAGIIDWIIVGGESGPHARPMHPDWAMSLRDQCQAAGVPYFFKQWGAWMPLPDYEPVPIGLKRVTWFGTDGQIGGEYDGGQIMVRVGKKTAGRLLDGRTWDELPEVRA